MVPIIQLKHAAIGVINWKNNNIDKLSVPIMVFERRTSAHLAGDGMVTTLVLDPKRDEICLQHMVMFFF